MANDRLFAEYRYSLKDQQPTDPVEIHTIATTALGKARGICTRDLFKDLDTFAAAYNRFLPRFVKGAHRQPSNIELALGFSLVAGRRTWDVDEMEETFDYPLATIVMTDFGNGFARALGQIPMAVREIQGIGEKALVAALASDPLSSTSNEAALLADFLAVHNAIQGIAPLEDETALAADFFVKERNDSIQAAVTLMREPQPRNGFTLLDRYLHDLRHQPDRPGKVPGIIDPDIPELVIAGARLGRWTYKTTHRFLAK